MGIIVFWDVMPLSLVVIYPEDGSSMYHRSVGIFQTTRLHFPVDNTLD
jgi:hypothetical protein